jgi:hypothetical protein
VTHDEDECRNEAHRDEAREVQRREREVFLEHFGSDFLVLPGAELPDALAGFWTALGRPWTVDREQWPEDLLDRPRVALAYDAVDGLTFYEEYTLLAGAFEGDDPSPEEIELVADFCQDPLVSPQIVRKIAEAHPDRRDAVLAAALDRPSFSWERDGEATLDDYKPDYVDGVPRPTVSVVPERLRPYVEAPDVARIYRART